MPEEISGVTREGDWNISGSMTAAEGFVGGGLAVTGVAGAATSKGKNVTITAAPGGSTAGNGGDVTISGGAATTGNGGNVLINAGIAADGGGGYVAIAAGNGSEDDNGGDVAITGGNASGADGLAGGVSITAGGAEEQNGADVNILGGESSSGAGGNVNLNGNNGATPGAVRIANESGKLSFFNGTPQAQGAAIADATGSGDAHTQLNLLLSYLRSTGLIDT